MEINWELINAVSVSPWKAMSTKMIIWLLVSVFWVVLWSEDVIETGVISDEFLMVAFGPLLLGLGIWWIRG